MAKVAHQQTYPANIMSFILKQQYSLLKRAFVTEAFSNPPLFHYDTTSINEINMNKSMTTNNFPPWRTSCVKSSYPSIYFCKTFLLVVCRHNRPHHDTDITPNLGEDMLVIDQEVIFKGNILRGCFLLGATTQLQPNMSKLGMGCPPPPISPIICLKKTNPTTTSHLTTYCIYSRVECCVFLVSPRHVWGRDAWESSESPHFLTRYETGSQRWIHEVFFLPSPAPLVGWDEKGLAPPQGKEKKFESKRVIYIYIHIPSPKVLAGEFWKKVFREIAI